MATIPELPEKTTLYVTDLLVMDDGVHSYKVQWATLLAILKTVVSFEADPDTEHYAGYLKLTLADTTVLRAKPSDPDKQDKLTFDDTPTEGSENPVTSGGVFTALGLKLDSADYVNFTGATNQTAGAAGRVPAPAIGTERYLSSSGSWQTPDSAPAESSIHLITSSAVFAALLSVLGQIAPAFDDQSTYALGSYCTHDGVLYRCSTAIDTAEEWNASHWTVATVGEVLTALAAQAANLSSAENITYNGGASSHTAGSVGAELSGLGVDDADQELAIQLILNELLHREAQFDALSGTVISQGTRLSTAEGNITSLGTRMGTAEGNIAKLTARTDIVAGTVTLTNSLAFPFNNSQITVPISAERDNQNYIVDYEVTAAVGNVGDIIVSAKLVNGFKLEYTGSATSVTVKYQVLGGMT